MAHVSSRRLKTARDLLVAGGIFAWALYHAPDALPDKSVAWVPPKNESSSSVASDHFQTSVPNSVKKTEASAPVLPGDVMATATATESASSEAALPDVPPFINALPHVIDPGVPAGDSDVSHHRAARNSIIPTDIGHRSEVRGRNFRAEVPQQPVKSPVAFAIAEADVKLAPLEEEVIYLAQQSFADEMKSASVKDPASPEYASHWQHAVEVHDDYLRRMLGWDKFNQLSALASQRSYAESGVLK